VDTLTLEVTFPNDLFALLGYSKPHAAEAVREFSVLGLYQERRISTGKAAELLGIGKREFARLLARKGIAYFDYSHEELADELQTVDEWKRERA
jgi:predicted HTH domain antitoxin